jgi:hypothetical protein
MKLLEWFRNRDLKKIAKQTKATYPGFESSESYLIFYQYSQIKHAEVASWERILKEAGKQVECLAFYDGKEKEIAQDIYNEHFSRKELSWWGRPKTEVFTKAITKPYHVFIDLSNGNHIAAKYVRYGSKAALKVNFGHQKEPWSDLQLDFKLKEQGEAARKALLKLLAFINK